MKLSDLYQHSIRYGALDARGPEACGGPEARRREYESLPPHEREAYDLSNPFGDVRLAYSPRPASEIEIRTVLLGIDIGVAELLLADHLRRKGVLVDAVVAHHTPNAGVAFNLAQDIMGVNVEMLVAQGVPLEDARRVIDPYVHERWLGNEDFHRQGPPRRAAGAPLRLHPHPGRLRLRGGDPGGAAAERQPRRGRGAGPADYPRGAVRAHLGPSPG